MVSSRVTVKLNVNGKEVEGIVIRRVRAKKKRRKHRDKEYEWVEHYINMYVPKEWTNKKLVLIGLD